METVDRIIEIFAELYGLRAKLQGPLGRKCKVFSRVVGFYAAVDMWHPAKQEEFKMRVNYSL